MDIDGSEKKPTVSETDSQEVADINETASAVVLTEEDQSALRTVLNAENTFKMGNSYKDQPKADNPSSHGYTSKFNNNQHVSADPTKQLEEIEGDSRMVLMPSEEHIVEKNPKLVYLDEIKSNSKLSLRKLNEHICIHHPKKFDKIDQDYKDWNICGRMPSLATCC